jgi:hypothetical protein
MELGGGAFSALPESGVEGDVNAASCLSVEELPASNGKAQHMFEAESLGAELNPIGIMRLGTAALVLDRSDVERRTVGRLELDGVAHAVQAQEERSHGNGRRRTDSGARFGEIGPVSPVVELPAFNGQSILRPEAFVVDQGALAGAINQVLQGGNR